MPAFKSERPALAGVQSQVLQHVAVRVDLAFQAFYRRLTACETPGYPRFRGIWRYDSLTFAQVPVGCPLDAAERRLRIFNVGLVRVLLRRPVEGIIKTATIRRSRTGKWYVSFACACPESNPLPATGKQVGIDVGLKVFAALSTEEVIANPHFFRAEERALAKAQRRLSNAAQGTPECAARRRVVARVYERMHWRRGDFAHQHSRHIVNQFDLIAVEDLSVKGMMQNHCLAKSIHDVAWSQFADLLSIKAALAGRSYVTVNRAYTSQDRSNCGQRQTLSLADRAYDCPGCGMILDRDLNAARNIVRLGATVSGFGLKALAFGQESRHDFYTRDVCSVSS